MEAAGGGGGVEAAWRRPEAEAEACGGGRQPDGISSAIREPGGASVGLLDLAKNGQVPRYWSVFFDLWYRLVAQTEIGRAHV